MVRPAEQVPQTRFPQSLQWWRRLTNVNWSLQQEHTSAPLSGTHTGALRVFMSILDPIVRSVRSVTQISFSSGVSANTVKDFSFVIIWNAFFCVSVSGIVFTLVFPSWIMRWKE